MGKQFFDEKPHRDIITTSKQLHTKEKLMPKLIPTDGGRNPINGLPIQNYLCVVFNASTLEILDVAETHNKADEIANHLYNTKQIDARSDGLKFHDDNITARDVIGMKLHQFQYFIDNNNHPLCPQD